MRRNHLDDVPDDRLAEIAGQLKQAILDQLKTRLEKLGQNREQRIEELIRLRQDVSAVEEGLAEILQPGAEEGGSDHDQP
jgi:hypothetical protein